MGRCDVKRDRTQVLISRLSKAQYVIFLGTTFQRHSTSSTASERDWERGGGGEEIKLSLDHRSRLVSKLLYSTRCYVESIIYCHRWKGSAVLEDEPSLFFPCCLMASFENRMGGKRLAL